MTDLTIVRPRQIEGKTNVFFSLGDFEVQEIAVDQCSLSRPALLDRMGRDLRMLTLLSGDGHVVTSASHFFESEPSRAVFLQNTDLFANGDVIFAISSDVTDFVGHLEKKRMVCPLTPCYTRRDADKSASDLQSLYGFALTRESRISGQIDRLWERDLSDPTCSNSLDQLISDNARNDCEASDFRQVLEGIPKDRGSHELVREYVVYCMMRGGLPRELRRSVCNRLADFYVIGSSQAMELAPMNLDDLAITTVETGITRYRVPLFLSTLRALGIEKHLLGMPNRDLLRMKHSDTFSRFLECYRGLIDETRRIEEAEMALCDAHFIEKFRRGYRSWTPLLKRLSQAALLASMSGYVATQPSLAIVSIVGPEMVDAALSRLLQVDRLPMTTFKDEVVKRYESRLHSLVNDIVSGKHL